MLGWHSAGMLHTGAFSPEDLAVMQTAFDELCASLGVSADSREAVDLAYKMIARFQNGTRSLEALIASEKTQVA